MYFYLMVPLPLYYKGFRRDEINLIKHYLKFEGMNLLYPNSPKFYKKYFKGGFATIVYTEDNVEFNGPETTVIQGFYELVEFMKKKGFTKC